MCGLAGWFDTRQGAGPPPSEHRRRAALGALAARGPDGEGAWVAGDGRAGLLHRRLAIVDREGGAQPMAGPSPGQMLAWNGELFDADLRRAALERAGQAFRTRSDTEVLARLLADDPYGAHWTREAGQWAVAWIDETAGRLVLARDPAGEKPLYWTADAATGRVAFASTLDALRALVPVAREIDPEALSLYLSWGFVPAPLTIHPGVFKVEAGARLVWTRGEPDAQPTRIKDRPRDAAPRAQPDDSSLEDALLAASRRRFEHSDEPVGVFLSGGLDSLAVVALLEGSPGLKAFTVRADDPRWDESDDAARVARALGVEHQVIAPPAAGADNWRDVLLRHGEPFGTASALAVDAVARAAAPHVRVVLTGDGGDEALGGYPRHVMLRRLARLPSIPWWVTPPEGARLRRVRRAARLLSLPPAERYAAMYEVFGDHRAAIAPDDDGSPARGRIGVLWGDADASDLDAMLRVDRALELPDSHCVKVDTACMAHGVEARSPWLDRDVVAACDALPAAERMRRGNTKRPLRALLRRRLPSDVADHVLSRPKRGFTPGLDAALASADAEALLVGGMLAQVPGVRPEGVERLLREHREGRGNHRYRLSVLLSLALFAEAHLT